MTKNEITETILEALALIFLIPAGAVLLTILWVLIQG